MADQTMIDRIAPALAHIIGLKGGGAGSVGDMREEAANLLRLMREPTEAMKGVLEELFETQGHHQTLDESWAMLIDAALAEG
jgi:hypothetical protein